MSKERLEAIRHYYREMESFDPGTQSDINWLIEQAERVQELEEENINLKAIKAGNEELIKILEQQNKRYREALEFYADENNYREHDLKGIVPPRSIAYKPILHDYGSIARKALEGEE